MQDHLRHPLVPALCVSLLLCVTLPAQTPSPQSLVAVAVAANGTTPAQGEMYWIDHQSNTATQITLPTALLTDRPNALCMTSAITGYLGTNDVTVANPGNIYGFLITNNTLSLTNNGQPLNTTPTVGDNVAQMVVVNNRIYFTTQTWNSTAQVIGQLQSIPTSGGPVVVELDLATLSANLSNAVTAIGSVVYVGMWNVNTAVTTGGELIAYDTTTSKGKKVMDLPIGKYVGSGTTSYGFGIVNIHATSANQLACLGVYGDIAIIDPDHANANANPKLVSHAHTGGRDANGNPTLNQINSGYYDPTTNDWVIGTRNGSIERWADGHTTEDIVTGVGSHPTATGNSVTALWHTPVANNSDVTYGAGCRAKAGGFTPTDASIGAAVAGNANFKLALWAGTGGETFLLALGVNNATAFGGSVTLPWDMKPIGASGCMLRVDPLVLIGGKLGGSGPGLGQATVPVALPANLPKNTFVHRQWAVNEPSGSLVVSNARTLTIK